jgi:predicted RND superfamily exporter protein
MDPAVVESQIVGNRLMVDGVVSKDKKVAMLVAELGTKQDDAQAQLRAYQIVRGIVAYQADHPEYKDEIFIAGMPIFIAAQQEIIDHDLAVLFPIVFLLITLLLTFFFRKPLGVLLPLFNILFCTIWTLGLMALLRVPFDLLTSVLPVFLFTICCRRDPCDGRILRQKNAGKSNREANRETQRLMVVPVVLTTVTTIATFMISTTNNIVSIRNFGVFMSIGLTAALIISLLLIPAWISWGKDQPAQAKADVHKESIISRYLVAFCAWMIRFRKPILLVVLPLLALATVFTFRVDIEDSGIAYFKPESHIRVSDQFINHAKVAGTAPGWIAIDSKEPRGVLTTDVVQFIDKLDHFIKQQPNVSYGYSLATYVKRMNLVLNDMNPDYLRVPNAVEQVTVVDDDGKPETFDVDGNSLIEQHIMMFENGGGTDLQNVLNADYSKAVTLFTMTSSVAGDYQAMLDKLDAWLLINKPANLQVTHAGTPYIWTGCCRKSPRARC